MPKAIVTFETEEDYQAFLALMFEAEEDGTIENTFEVQREDD